MIPCFHVNARHREIALGMNHVPLRAFEAKFPSPHQYDDRQTGTPASEPDGISFVRRFSGLEPVPCVEF